MMKKARNTFLIIWAICFALYNVIVFVVPNENYGTEGFWLGYALITVALLGNLVSSYIALNSKTNAKLFNNIPLITTSIVETVVSSIAGAIFIAVPGIKSWAIVVVSAIILAVSAIASVIAKSTADAVGDIDDKIKKQTSFIKSITLDAEMLMASATTPEIKAEIKKVYEAFRFSDPMSSDVLNDVEDRIQNQFNLLSEVVIREDEAKVSQIAKDLLSLIDYRNKKCKISK
jgi:hypothetical protein